VASRAPLGRPPRRSVVDDLNRVPPLSAAAIVLGVAIATMLVLAGFESLFGGDDENPTPQRRTAAPAQAPVDLGDARYPDARGRQAQPEPEQGAPEGPSPPRVPMRRLVGEKLMVRMTGTSPSASLLSRVRRGQVGGVVLFADNIGSKSDVRRLTSRLQAASRAGGGSGIFIAIDQEGGVVKRLRSAPPTRSAPQIGATGRSSVAQNEGAATGAYLRRLGINVDFAPVADTPATAGAFISNRAFGRNPRLVGRMATNFAAGLQNQGVAATAKHFPGLGSSTTNTDNAAATINATRAALDRQARPFADTIRGGIQLVMTATAIYPALHPGVPAAFSRRIVTGRLREGLQFNGLIVTDDLETPAVRSYTSPADGAVQAVAAGNDMVLLVRSERGSRAAYSKLIAAAKSGRLKRSELEASHLRLESLRGGLQP
jgi:beta-N-acetylhexosaminidase